MALPVNNTSDSPASLSADTADKPLSLSKPAPAGPIPSTAWRGYISDGRRSLEYRSLLAQENACIRSLRKRTTLTYESSRIPGIVSTARDQFHGIASTAREYKDFPYPKAYQKLLLPPNLSQRRGEDEEHRIPDNESTGGQQSPRVAQSLTKDPTIGISTRYFGFSWTSKTEFESQIQPTYVVLGLFLRGSHSPKERVVFVDKPEQLFSKLRWAVFRLRGIRGFFLSLKHLKGFRLFKCDAGSGTHERIILDDNAIGDLQLLMSVYKSWFVSRHISQAWSDWIHCTLNKERLNVLEGEYGLELVLDWSVTRISIVVLVPVLLSLAIGLWLNSRAWTDLATIQTAWGTASYIVTAGALLAAMLGFLDIADK